MAAFVNTSRTILLGAAWTGTAPGLPGTQTVSGTISSASDISAYVRGGNPAPSVAMQDGTNFASGGFVIQYPGLKTGDTITFYIIGDYASSTVYPIIQTTLGGLGSLVYLDLKATSASRGATNPSFVAAAYISQWQPIGGNVGDLASMSLGLTITGKFDYLAS